MIDAGARARAGAALAMPLVVGHRGARELWPENSLEGFRATAALGVDAIELDVHATMDGGIAVIHDPTLERTTEGRGPVAALSMAEIAATRLRGTSFDTVPSLDTVLGALQRTGIEVQIEIKTDATGTGYPGLTRRVVDLIRARGMQEQVLVVSFVPAILREALECWPQARLVASLDRRSAELMGGLDAALDSLAQLPGCVVAIEKGLLRANLDRCLDRLGSARVAVWTVNESDEIAWWMRVPVRHMVTDRPDIALATRNLAPNIHRAEA